MQIPKWDVLKSYSFSLFEVSFSIIFSLKIMKLAKPFFVHIPFPLFGTF